MISWIGACLFTWIFFLPAFAPELQRGLTQVMPETIRTTFTPEWNITPTVRLRWLLTLLPAGMIVHHALFLRYQRIKQFPHAQSRSLGEHDPILRPTVGMRDTYFSVRSLALSYFFPAIMVGALCSTMLIAAFQPTIFVPQDVLEYSTDWQRLIAGLKAGFAGAYVYVVMTLAQRAVRRDVTSGVPSRRPPRSC